MHFNGIWPCAKGWMTNDLEKWLPEVTLRKPEVAFFAIFSYKSTQNPYILSYRYINWLLKTKNDFQQTGSDHVSPILNTKVYRNYIFLESVWKKLSYETECDIFFTGSSILSPLYHLKIWLNHYLSYQYEQLSSYQNFFVVERLSIVLWTIGFWLLLL